MSFQPVVPLSGLAGWRFLERTMERQQDAFNKSPEIRRDVDYFVQKIGEIDSAEALVADRRLLKVALGAFGLQDDINNTFFIKKVLADGAEAKDALANKLADKSYLKLAEAFGFGGTGAPRTQQPGFGEEIRQAYLTRSFEVAVGTQDDSMRLALNMERELQDIAARDISDDARWFSVLGSVPLRKVFDTAFGLPKEFAALDLDRQLEVYRDKARALFGGSDLARLADPETRETLLKTFLIRAEAGAVAGGYSPARTALTLLGG